MKAIVKYCMVAIVLLLVLQSCEDTNKPDPVHIDLNPKSQKLIDADNAFGFELLQKIVDSEEDSKNIMISPLSVSLALAMTYNGSDGTTKEAMEETLHLTGLSVDDINESYKNLVEAMVNLDPKVKLEIANSIWYRRDFDVEQEFLDVNQAYFDAEVSALDFGLPESLTTINNWVAENTNDKIKKILNQIDPLDVMFLINAIYFNGLWTYQFDPDMTDDGPFYMIDGSGEEVPFMKMEADVMYHYNDLFEAIELPYGKGDYSMIVVLPAEGKTTKQVIAQLNPENWESWLGQFYLRQGLEIHLPKFRFEYEKGLKEVLSMLGMSVAFSPVEADFSKINSLHRLFISRVKHKTFIEVDEEGTEAAAVTAVAITLTSIQPPNIFQANRPFVFIIKENTSNAILFAGRVALPLIED
jgi:serpin B